MQNIVMMPIKEVHPYPNNPRINKEAIDKVAASLRSFGWRQPIVIDKDNVIIVGHTRLQAAKRLRMKEVPVLVADDLTEDQVKAYRLADNKTAEFSEWDMDKLGDELADILDIDMETFGFDLNDFIKEPKVTEDNYEPVLPVEPKAKRGDIYLLGRHRLMCGDAQIKNDVDKLVDNSKMDMLLTDPPANNNLGEGYRGALFSAFGAGRSVLKNGASFHIWIPSEEQYNVLGACEDAGLVVRQQLIWVKNNMTAGRQDFQRQYEQVITGDTIFDEDMIGYQPCLYGWKEGEHKWYKKKKEKDVLFFEKPLASAEFPMMKPILLFNYEMQCNTQRGDKVLDLFAGTGTTILAAQQNGRTAYCMEIDPAFVDAIINRYELFTGEEAVLISKEEV